MSSPWGFCLLFVLLLLLLFFFFWWDLLVPFVQEQVFVLLVLCNDVLYYLHVRTMFTFPLFLFVMFGLHALWPDFYIRWCSSDQTVPRWVLQEDRDLLPIRSARVHSRCSVRYLLASLFFFSFEHCISLSFFDLWLLVTISKFSIFFISITMLYSVNFREYCNKGL